MKRLWIVLIGLIFISGLIYSQAPIFPVSAESFQKVTQKKLTNRKAQLTQMKTRIEEFFSGMANDTIISGKEMRALRKLVKKFDKTKNKELKFYEVQTRTNLKLVIRKCLKIYFKDSIEDSIKCNFSDNKEQEIEKNFVSKKEHDVKVEKTRDWVSAVAIGFLLAVLIVFFAILFFIVIMLSDKKILILSLVVFVVAWILFTLFI